jgi:hypothetical protein
VKPLESSGNRKACTQPPQRGAALEIIAAEARRHRAQGA